MKKSLPDRRSMAAAFLILGIAAGSCVDSTAPAVLSSPSNVTVTLVGPHSARVTWTPSGGPAADYVETYNIYRDGVKIGQTPLTTFLDNNLVEGVTYKYRVTAEGFGIVSELSAESSSSAITVPDITAPTVSSTTPAANATGVALSATVSATFSEPLDATTVNGSTFFVKTGGGALIPATVTYNTTTRTALLTPTAPLPNAAPLSATITTGIKDVPGNKLAADFTFSFTTRDEVPPTVVASSPANGAAGVQPNSPITMTFSEAMDASTITAANVTLKLTSSGSTVSGTVAYNPATLTATFTPSASLAFGTGYTLAVSTAAKDASGNSLAAVFSAAFTTAGAPDTTAPSVVSITPANGAAGVSVNTAISVQFSEAMDPLTINSNTISLVLASNSAPVSGTVSYSQATNTATFTPSAALSFGTSYVASVAVGAKDQAGNPLAAAAAATFTTASAPDATSPNVVSVTPAHLTSGVPISTVVTVQFSESMNPLTINTSTIVLTFTGTATAVPGSVSYNPATNSGTFTPSSLAFSTSYTVTVNGVTDLAGNGLASPFSSIFATGAAPDVTPPTVSSSSPINGATGVARTVAPTVTFSEAMNGSTINGNTIVLKVTSSGTQVPGTVSYDPGTNTATFTPSTQLSFSTQYTLSVLTGVQDLAGNPLASQFNATFTVAPNPDTTRPTVIASARLGAAGPPLENRSIASVTFSEPMNSATINNTNITLQDDRDLSSVAGTVSYDSGTNTAFFTASPPAGYVASGTGSRYSLKVSTGVTDLAGNSLASPFTSSGTRVSYYQGTSEEADNTKAQIHVHITFSQSGQTLGRAVECVGLPGADCDLLPRNQAAVDAVGPLDDQGSPPGGVGIAATVTALSGTVNGSNITFTFSIANSRSFTFTGTLFDNNPMTGSLTGATLAGPVSITLAR
jgi:hypothetical protein